MSNDLGSNAQPILGDSQRDEPLDELRSEFQQIINGYKIRADRIGDHLFVSIDGKPFAGSFIEAIQAAGKRPIRWAGMFGE